MSTTRLLLSVAFGLRFDKPTDEGQKGLNVFVRPTRGQGSEDSVLPDVRPAEQVLASCRHGDRRSFTDATRSAPGQ